MRKRFGGVLALIEPKAGGWGEIKARKGTIAVSAVQPGAERELQHLLDSVVTQLNSDLGQGVDAEPAEQGSDGDAGDRADREMSERFRAFAEGAEPRS